MTFEKIDDSNYLIDIIAEKDDSTFFGASMLIVKLEKDTEMEYDSNKKRVSFQITKDNYLDGEEIKELIEDGIKYRKIKEAEKLKKQ